MESLQREGRTLFEDCSFGGTADLSSAYHHVDMHESAHTFLGFEWQGAGPSLFHVPHHTKTFLKDFFVVKPRHGESAPPRAAAAQI